MSNEFIQMTWISESAQQQVEKTRGVLFKQTTWQINIVPKGRIFKVILTIVNNWLF